MRLLFVNDTESELPEAFLNNWVGSMTKELSRRKVLPKEKEQLEVSLVFLKEADAKQLNWSYRQKDYATDILSFTSEDPESLGELVMCPEVLVEQAKTHKVPYEHELGYMILHGVLHLLGFEHEKDEEAETQMMSLQDQVFEILRTPPKPPKAAKSPAPKAPAPKAPVVKAAAKPAKHEAKPAKTAKAAKAAPAKKTAPVTAKAKPAAKKAAPKKAASKKPAKKSR